MPTLIFQTLIIDISFPGPKSVDGPENLWAPTTAFDSTDASGTYAAHTTGFFYYQRSDNIIFKNKIFIFPALFTACNNVRFC